MTINERIKEIMNKENLNFLSFGKQLGYSDVVVGNIVKGRNKPSYDFLNKLIQIFDWINAEWLLIGKGSMLKDPSQQSSSIEEFLKTENKTLNARIEELNREIGRLQNELKNK